MRFSRARNKERFMNKTLSGLVLLTTVAGAFAATSAQQFVASGSSELHPSSVEVIDGKMHVYLPITNNKKWPAAFAVDRDGQKSMLVYSAKPTATGVEYVFERPVDGLILRLGDKQSFIAPKR